MPVTRICGVYSPLRPELADEAALARMCSAMTGAGTPLHIHAVPESGFAVAMTAHPRMAGSISQNWQANEDGVVALDGNVLQIVGSSDGTNGAAAVSTLIQNGTSLEQLEGDFAGASWDPRTRRLILTLDPLGKKPLYYHHDASTGLTVFASEARGVLAYPGMKRAPSMDGISLFLRDGYILAPYTAFEGIRKLGIGEEHRFEADGSERGRVYWSLEDCTDDSKTREEWQEALRARLIGDMRRNLLGRDAGGIFLGAGIDSTVMTGMLSQGVGAATRTITAGFEAGSRTSEGDTSYGRRVADFFGVPHQEIVISPETVRPHLAPVYRQMDEPHVPVSNVLSGVMMIDQLLEHGIDVSFSGISDGEVFGPSSFTGVARMRESGELKDDDDVRRHFVKPVLMDGDRQAQLTGAAREQTDSLAAQCLQPYRAAVHFSDVFNEVIAVNKLTGHHGEGTQFSEHMASMTGTEVRLAMLDWHTLRFAFQVPSRFKGFPDPSTHRQLLKDGFKDYLPDFVLNRAKSGLPGYVISDYNFHRLSEVLFSPQRLSRAGFLNPKAISRDIKKKQFRKVLSLLMIWLELHIYQDESVLELL